ncbi:MAG TPA: T9SS type A sorting domain-containing protein, partial [Luteibaculaceae bacterium]|nr:T9SS type A sorting domain-containing protein [Luteibaculaceae bacterium]
DNGRALGCDTLTFTVAANPDPTVAILPSDTIDVCRGVDLPLNGNPQNGTPGFTHLWTPLDGGVLSATNSQQVVFTGSNPLGSYRFSYMATDANGCSAADTLLINVQPPASAGSAIAQPNQICSGQSTNFQVSNAIGTISWESGPTSAGPWTAATLTDNGMGLFTTAALTTDVYFRYTATRGVCSETSSAIFVEVLPIAAKPIVLADSLVGCSNEGIVLRTINYSQDIVWNDDQPTVNDSLEVFQTGFYVATTTGLCPSASDSVFVTINPSPQKPSITSLDGVTQCENDVFRLISSLVGNNLWSTGESTDTIVFVSDGAVTVAQVNAFGCQTQSDTLFLSYIPRPAKPGISLLSTGLLCEGSPVQLAADTSGSLTWSTGDITDTIEVSSSGAYTVSFRGANGCDAVSDTFNLNLLPTPAKPQISPSGPACQGTPLVLYSDYTGVNTWSDGSTADSLFISANGEYSVTVLGANGCTSTSDLFTVLFATPPAKPLISQVADTLFASGNAASYQWFNPNGPIPGAVNRAFVPGTRDLYAVVAISPEGCVSPLSDPLLFSGVGIDELILSNLLIYPNPSQGRFQVDLKGQLADQLKLMDVTGKIVYQQPIQGSNVTLQVPLQSGLYFLSFQRDGRWSKAYKITIQ